MPEQISPNMSLEDWYWDLLARPDHSDRVKLLAGLRSSNPEMASELEKMLASHTQAGLFLELDDNRNRKTTRKLEATIDSLPNGDRSSVQIPDLIGPYKLLEPIGEGGMGLVYLAQQSSPVRRKVAVKIIKPGMDSRQVVARFEAERQALAMMEHPNIAKVLDAGTTDSGLPYFVMELVRGIPITDYCDRSKMTTRQRLELFYEACAAIQHAHNKGIIHRDIKPSNVLVTEHDGIPVVKVIDFGVAKALTDNLTDKTLYTGVFQMIGTPLYMSPEQASLSNLDVDVRSDVYSLGVLLYELVAGVLPIDRERAREMSFDQLRQQICDTEPLRPSKRLSTLRDQGQTIAERDGIHRTQLAKSLAGELDWIVMRAIEKDRKRRYQSARELGEDVQRHLSGEPVEACPPTYAYRIAKTYRRHRALLITTAALWMVLLAGAVGTAWQAYRATLAEADAESRLKALEKEQSKTQMALTKAELAEKQQRLLRTRAEASEQDTKRSLIQQQLLRSRAEASERDAKWRLYVANLYPMRTAWMEQDFGKLDSLLDAAIPAEGENDYRGWEWYYLKSQVQQSFEKVKVEGVEVVGPVAYCEATGQVAAKNREQGQEIIVFNSDQSTIKWRRLISRFGSALAFSNDGSYLAASTGDGRLILLDQTGDVILTTESLGTDIEGAWIPTITWKSDGTQVAFANHYGTIAVLDVVSREVEILKRPASPWFCGRLDWHPSKNLLAAGLRWGERRIFDLDRGTSVTLPEISGAVGNGVAWSPDGQLLACSEGSEVRIVDRELRLVSKLIGHFDDIRVVEWLDNKRLVTSGSDHTLRCWNATTGEETRKVSVHNSVIRHLAIDRTRGVALSGSFVSGLKRVPLDLKNNRYVNLLPPDQESFYCRRLVWSPDGSLAAAIGNQAGRPMTALWTANGRLPVSWTYNTKSRGLDWSENGERLLRIESSGALCIVDPHTGTSMFSSLVLDEDGISPRAGSGIGFLSPNYQRIFCLNEQHASILELSTLVPQASIADSTGTPTKGQWSPDGRKIAFGRYKKPKIFTLGDPHDCRQLDIPSAFSQAWHPESRLIVFGGEDGRIHFFDNDKDRVILERPAHRGAIEGADISPDGRRLATAGNDGFVGISDTATGDELLRLALPNNVPVQYLAWSPDGYQLAAATNRDVLVWSVHPEHEMSQSLDYLPTGKIVAALDDAGSDQPFATPVDASPWKRWYAELQAAYPATDEQPADPAALLGILATADEQDWPALTAALRNWLDDQKTPNRSVELARMTLGVLESEPLLLARIEVSRCLLRQLIRQEDWESARAANQEAIELASMLIDRRDATATDWRIWESVNSDLVAIAMGQARRTPVALEGDADATEALLEQLTELEIRLQRVPKWAYLIRAESEQATDNSTWLLECVEEIVQRSLDAGQLSVAMTRWAEQFDQTDYYSHYQKALCYAAAGERERYQAVCDDMLRRFADSDDVEEISFTVWTCALLPDAVGDYRPVFDLIQRAVDESPDSPMIRLYQAAIYYRAGQLEESQQAFAKLDDEVDSRSSPVYLWLFQALLAQEVGDEKLAGELFDKAQQFVSEGSNGEGTNDAAPIPWNRKATQLLLLDQVRRRLKKSEASDNSK